MCYFENALCWVKFLKPGKAVKKNKYDFSAFENLVKL